jgi:hypothetical protein
MRETSLSRVTIPCFPPSEETHMSIKKSCWFEVTYHHSSDLPDPCFGTSRDVRLFGFTVFASGVVELQVRQKEKCTHPSLRKQRPNKVMKI